MISREEALDSIFRGKEMKKPYPSVDDTMYGRKQVLDYVSKIYDSIGSCGECKHYIYKDLDDGTMMVRCDKDIVFFKRLSSVNKCSCDEFERVEDDT